MKSNFWVGMSTTQRSEGMNAFFDGFINSTTTLQQFVVQYDNAIHSKVDKECEIDFSSHNMTFHVNLNHLLRGNFKRNTLRLNSGKCKLNSVQNEL